MYYERPNKQIKELKYPTPFPQSLGQLMLLN